ncbi:MAG TPA: efflux RND transporter permease subunit [Gemmatimonadaceae bacterium]|nr:efflux RND transporter permease subunit [Gemmatimonadaceae bacterium]
MMISDLSIRRPVLTSMLAVALVLFGVLGYLNLSVREYPDVDAPVISVATFLRGANPRVMESAVTDILEEELSTVPGLRTLTSSSAEQFSYITLEFTLDRDIETVAQDVRDKVSRVRDRLPDDIEEPVIAKEDADAQPFYWMALTSDSYNLLQLSDIGDRLVKPRLQTITGVGRAQVFGERRLSMRVWVSPSELAARGLTVQDISSAIQSRNVEVPAGRIESDRREFTVRSMGELKTPDEFGNIVVSNTEGQMIRLKDIARVELGPEDERTTLRYNQVPAVAIGVVRQSKANLVEVADGIKAELPAIQAALPPGVKLIEAFNGAVFVKRSIQEAEETLLIAGVLVVLIIFVFLRNLRATVIPALAIPTSIVATFGVMYFLGFSINNLTLLALTLAIGIVVDDAIIVLENAYRHQEELKESPEVAAVNGTREIAFAVIATTISLIAVFTPLAFLQGNTGRLFNEFGIAVAGAVAVSGFVALTLTPMLCARILRVPPRHGPLYQKLERGFESLSSGYKRSLGWAVANRRITVGASALIIVAAVFIFRALEREFVPPEDRGFFFTIVIAPEGSSLGYTDGYTKQVEAILGRTKDIEGSFGLVGAFGPVSQGIVFSRLTDWSDRDRSVQDIINEVQPQFFGIPGVFAFANNPPAFGWGSPLQFVVRHPDFDSLTKGMAVLTQRAATINGLINIDTDLKINKPELNVTFDRDRAEDLGVPIRDIAGTLGTMLGGGRVSTFTMNNKLYDVMVQLAPEERATPSDMSGLYVRGNDGQLVQLSAVARVDETVGPQGLNHFNRVRSFTLSAGLAPGFTLGAALDSLNRVAREILPAGSTIELAGESRELEESGSALYFAFALALIVVFMVLASQFESLLHPFTVLLAVPLAVTGALATLLIAGSTLNLYSQIAMVLLIGLVTKNSILLVEYANQLKARGLSTIEAILESGRVRLRPILMTSVATIMGALPIALGLGAGSASRRPLGYAIVGGLLFSTILTLFLVPAVYVMMDHARARVRARTEARGRRKSIEEPALAMEDAR